MSDSEPGKFSEPAIVWAYLDAHALGEFLHDASHGKSAQIPRRRYALQRMTKRFNRGMHF